MVGGFDDRTVPRNVSHGGERVEHLSPRDPGHAVHAESRELLLGKLVNERLVLFGVEERVEDAAVLE